MLYSQESRDSLFPICVMVPTKPHEAKNTLLEDKVSAAVFHPCFFLSDCSARCLMSLKWEEVGEKSRMAAGVWCCCCRLPPSSLALKTSSSSGADNEVCTHEDRCSNRIICCETFCPLLSSVRSCQFVYESHSVWASHPAGSVDVGAHS